MNFKVIFFRGLLLAVGLVILGMLWPAHIHAATGLIFTTSDPDPEDTVSYQIQITNFNDSNFDHTLIDFTSNQQTTGDKTFTVGEPKDGVDGSYAQGSTITELSDGVYLWRVKAVDQHGAASSYSDIQKFIIIGRTITLRIPLSIDYTDTEATLTWKNPVGTARVDVYRSVEKSFITSSTNLIKTINSVTMTTYLDSGLDPITTYYYKVNAYDSAGVFIVSSNEVKAVTGEQTPPNPTNVKAIYDNQGAIAVSWQDPADTAVTSIEVYRSNSKTRGARVAIVPYGQQFYLDTNVLSDQTYYYILVSVKKSGKASTGTQPVTPSKVGGWTIITGPINNLSSPTPPQPSPFPWSALAALVLGLAALGLNAKSFATLFASLRPLPSLNSSTLPTAPFDWKETKKHPWGTVLDASTLLPLKGIRVSIHETSFNRMLDSTTTDASGRFALRINQPGTYIITATGANYQTFNTIPMTINSPQSVPVSLNISLQPVNRLAPQSSLRKVFHSIDMYLRHIRLPLIIIGTIWTLYLLFFSPTLLAYITITLYLLIWIIELVTHLLPHPLGKVLESVTRQPLDRVIVRLIKQVDDRQALIGTQVTHADGVFMFLITPGTYLLSVMRPGYISQKQLPSAYTHSTSSQETLTMEPTHRTKKG